MDGLTDGWMDGWMDGDSHSSILSQGLPSPLSVSSLSFLKGAEFANLGAHWVCSCKCPPLGPMTASLTLSP